MGRGRSCRPRQAIAGIESVTEKVATRVIRIPLRWPPGAPLPFQPEDVVLDEGDVVFLETRNTEFFYTGGILPSNEIPLPRDRDLDVVEAVAQVTGSLLNGAVGGNNLSGTLIRDGLGKPSPSALSVVRRTPDGGQVSIHVDLNRAMRDPRERILVRPGDLLILQETPGEAFLRYASEMTDFLFIWSRNNRDTVDFGVNLP